MADIFVTFAQALSNITGLSPTTNIIILGFIIAVLPVARRGKLDDRLKNLVNRIDYASGVLTATFLYTYYLLFGSNFGEELILIAGGFVIGTFVSETLRKITGLD